MRWFTPLAFSLLCSFSSAWATEEVAVQAPPSRDVEAEVLLKRMAHAMQITNYEGILLHMRGEEARSLRVLHRFDAERGEREHLLSLDGKPFEVVQDPQGCTCVWPQSKTIVLGQSPAFNSGMVSERFAQTATLGDFYSISRRGYARVGGIACRLVNLEPKDAYRFAYRLCIHEPSGLLLHLEVFDGARRLELSQFTQLRVRHEDVAEDMRLFNNVEGFRILEDKREGKRETADGTAISKALPPTWEARQLPPGYQLRSSGQRISPHNGKPMEQLIYSDGLGSISVFIEAIDSAAPMPAEAGKPRRGVMQRVVREADGYRLTAVGDAPQAAMQSLLDAMQPVGGK